MKIIYLIKKSERIGALATEGYIFYPASWSKGHPRQPVYYFQTCWGFLSESLFPFTNFTIESKPNEGEKCYFLFPRISFPYHVTHHSSSICMKEGDALVLLLNNRPGFLFFLERDFFFDPFFVHWFFLPPIIWSFIILTKVKWILHLFLLLVRFVANANMSFIFNFHLGVCIFRKLDRSVQVFYSIGFILLSYAISDFLFPIIDLLW